MSNEIATYSMILSKLSLGKSGTECPTKTQILAINSLIVIDNASTYGANECVKIDDIRKKVETWNYYLTVSPTSMSFGAGGGSKTFTVSSYKRKVLDGVEQSGDTSVSLKSTVISGSGFSLSGTTVSASANEGTSNRTGIVTITQNESNKTATISLSQSGATPSTTYTFSVNPYKVSVGSSGGTGSVTISSYKTVGSSTYAVDYSIDSSTLPSWASFNKSTSTFTIQSTTSTTGRTAKVYFDQAESGKRDYAELTQTGYTPPADNYVFTWSDGSTSDTSANFPWNFSTNGTAANIPVVSTKNGSSQSWSVSSKPSWITTSTTSSKVTISASDNSGSARSGTIVLTQSGSNKTLRINVSQAAYSATVEWRYKFGFNNGARDNISIAIRTMKEYDGASVTFASYKSKYVDGVEDVSSRQYVDFSIGDYASWATVTKVSSSIANEGKFKFTLSSNFNNKSNRQTSVTVTQNESNKSITCDIMQVGSDAFVATYYSHVRGSDTYPDEISFGIVTTPTTKQYEWESTFEVHTVDSDYDAYIYNYGAISEVKKVTANASMNTTWFGYEYIQNGGSYQCGLLKVNAPKSDGINHHEKLYISQLVTSAPSTSYNYREITNTPIVAEILVTQKGNIIS